MVENVKSAPQANPANVPPQQSNATRKRIPMSVPQRRLEVPDMPGYHLHWFRDVNVPRAIQAGYEMVKDGEVKLNQFNVGADAALSGNADLGTNIKVIAGTGEDGKPEHLNLMKIREEWWLEDQKVLESRNASVLQAIFTKEAIAGSESLSSEDKAQRYVNTALLQRPPRKV